MLAHVLQRLLIRDVVHQRDALRPSVISPRDDVKPLLLRFELELGLVLAVSPRDDVKPAQPQTHARTHAARTRTPNAAATARTVSPTPTPRAHATVSAVPVLVQC